MKSFKKIYIEITNICNLSCSFCPGHSRKKEYMSHENFALAIEKTKNYGDNFYLHLMGEPLNHPEFNKIMDTVKEHGIKANITTNGTLLREYSNIILNSNIRMVSVSMHSFEANCLNKSLLKYLDTIIEFCKAARDYNTIVELRLWNVDDMSGKAKNTMNEDILNYIEKNLMLDFNLINAIYDMLNENKNTNRRKRNIKLMKNIYLGTAEYFEWPDIKKSENIVCTGFCYGLRNQIAILANGQVSPCCLDSDGTICLGNIFTHTLEEIITAPRSISIYEGFTQRKAVEPLCQTCGYMKKFI